MQTKFIIERADRYIGFTLYSGSGRALMFSRLFRSVDQCYAGIHDLRIFTAAGSNIERLRNDYEQHSFVIRGSNKIILAHSQMFLLETEMLATIDYVCREAKYAILEDSEATEADRRILT